MFVNYSKFGFGHFMVTDNIVRGHKRRQSAAIKENIKNKYTVYKRERKLK